MYVLDPDHSFVHFEVTHFGTSISSGRFGPVSGEVTHDRALGTGEVGVRVASASIDTDLAISDACLRRGGRIQQRGV